MADLTLQLKDGRKLGYIEYGDRSGYPVMFFHGTPGSRILFLEDSELAIAAGIHLISLDRPGYGISDPKHNRTILEWADDIREVASLLKLTRFSIIGVSGGGAYAAACGYKLPDLLDSVALVSSAVPFINGKPPKKMMTANKVAFFMSKWAPWLIKAAHRSQKKLIQKDPEKFMKLNKDGNKHLNESDRQFLQKEEDLRLMMIHLAEAFRISVDECANELALIAKPWGFSHSDITVPVDVWHGEEDTMAPVEEMKKLAPTIPNCEEHYIPKAGHFVADDEETYKIILETILRKSHSETSQPRIS
ncbi:alpha/beta fold hydrolase [Peribacillus acanthi]|uniref:alpha/beta fold hydrolase n=1 Tax=Peribacillus acanthi TaxID=2171554 RepID=UPI000D3EA237|nr:alpha/beta hydrolase [Peribacillus acanthi]